MCVMLGTLIAVVYVLLGSSIEGRDPLRHTAEAAKETVVQITSVLGRVVLLSMKAFALRVLGGILAMDLVPSMLVAAMYASPVGTSIEDRRWGPLVVSVLAMTGHVLLWAVRGGLPNTIRLYQSTARTVKAVVEAFEKVSAPAVVTTKGSRKNVISFTVDQLLAVEQEMKELESRRQGDFLAQEANRAAVFYALKSTLAELGNTRRTCEAKDALCIRRQATIDERTELLVDQGNLALALKTELQHTRDALQQCWRDREDMAAEIGWLRNEIELLRDRPDPVPPSDTAVQASPSDSTLSRSRSIDTSPSVSPSSASASLTATSSTVSCNSTVRPKQANAKTASRKANRSKKKLKQTGNTPGRMPVGAPKGPS